MFRYQVGGNPRSDESPWGKSRKTKLVQKQNHFVPPGLGRVSQQTLMTVFREALVQLGLGGSARTRRQGLLARQYASFAVGSTEYIGAVWVSQGQW